MAMQALLNNGDEVLIPAPDYPLWTAAVTLSGGHPVHYICDEQADCVITSYSIHYTKLYEGALLAYHRKNF